MLVLLLPGAAVLVLVLIIVLVLMLVLVLVLALMRQLALLEQTERLQPLVLKLLLVLAVTLG